MNRLFYFRLAFNNVKRNSKTYIPYIITSIANILMFYIMHSLAYHEEIVEYSHSLTTILKFGVIVIGIFSTVFLLYTNSFLIKRRKKEIGLYNILGLEKKHIAKILFFETTITIILCLVLGLSSGIVLSKLMFLLLLNLLELPVNFRFTISITSILITTVVFLGIFLLIYLYNLLHIKTTKPIDLLKGEQLGEKEPKSKWIITILGIVTLTSGYTIALCVKSPLAAILSFLIAVILVMIGTYALFTSGSIVFLKLLRKNNNFYYKTKNFFSVSNMIYRMKQNAIGLANICLLSTAFLVVLSGTVALYIGMDDAIRTRFPKDIVIIGEQLNENEQIKLNELVNDQIKSSNLKINDRVDYNNQTYYCTKENGNIMIQDTFIYTGNCLINTIPVSDYNRIEGKNITLSSNELILYYDGGSYKKDYIKINSKTYRIKDELKEFNIASDINGNIIDSYILVINDYNPFGTNDNRVYLIGFNSLSTNNEIIEFTNHLKETLNEHNLNVSVNSAAANRSSFLVTTGGLFFIGFLLGILFLIETVLIIYYKQISEGFDDKKRFSILQKVGISKHEIKNTIRRQVLLMFFLPLIFTIIHLAFAFPIITKLLAVLNLTNIRLYFITTIVSVLVFSIIYLIVFILTAKTYYKIVER